MRTVLSHLSVLALAGLLAACNSTGNPSGSGGQGGNGSPSAGGNAADTSTSSGTGGTSGTGGSSAGTGGTRDAGSSSQGGSTGTSQTGGSGMGDGGVATGGRAGDGGVERGTGGSAGRATGGGGGSGGRSNGGSVADGGGTAGKECTPPTSYDNLFVTVSGHTQAESDDKVSKAWSTLFNPGGSGTIYFNGPGADESYVQDIYNNDVRSEGMSYGMMVAVQLDHQTEFDRIWKWVKNHMANGTGEISWSCKTSGAKNSSGGAPDGEEYFATALIFASHRWGDSTGPGKIAYATEAKWVLNVIRTKYFNSQYHLVKFVSSSSNVDPSYVLPAFYEVWACFDTANADFWNESVSAARQFFHAAADSNGVIGDRQTFTGDTLQGAGSDAKRCVMNIMMDHNFFAADPWQVDTYAPAFGAYTYNDMDSAQLPCNGLLGFALADSSGQHFVDNLWSQPLPTGTWRYYAGTLHMLALLHVSGTFKLWY